MLVPKLTLLLLALSFVGLSTSAPVDAPAPALMRREPFLPVLFRVISQPLKQLIKKPIKKLLEKPIRKTPRKVRVKVPPRRRVRKPPVTRKKTTIRNRTKQTTGSIVRGGLRSKAEEEAEKRRNGGK